MTDYSRLLSKVKIIIIIINTNENNVTYKVNSKLWIKRIGGMNTSGKLFK